MFTAKGRSIGKVVLGSCLPPLVKRILTYLHKATVKLQLRNGFLKVKVLTSCRLSRLLLLLAVLAHEAKLVLISED